MKLFSECFPIEFAIIRIIFFLLIINLNILNNRVFKNILKNIFQNSSWFLGQKNCNSKYPLRFPSVKNNLIFSAWFPSVYEHEITMRNKNVRTKSKASVSEWVRRHDDFEGGFNDVNVIARHAIHTVSGWEILNDLDIDKQFWVVRMHDNVHHDWGDAVWV